MTVEALLADLSARDVVVTVAGDSIELDAPAGVLTDADLVALRNHKPDVLQSLRLAQGLPIHDAAARLLAMEEVEPDEVPVCSACGRFCDVQTCDDAWHCSICDPLAGERRQRTERLLQLAALIRYTDSRNG